MEEVRLGGPSVLSAKQAADQLGVKVETIYAYVSRGLLDRLPGEDGRSSVFDARSIERLAARKRGGAKAGGISVVLGTSLTLIEQERVAYRGLDVATLSKTAPFEAVADWLWLEQPLQDVEARWVPWRASPTACATAEKIQSALPDGTATADRLRSIVSAAGLSDPFRFDLDPAAVAACARRLIAVEVDSLPRSRAEAEQMASVPALELPDWEPLHDSVAARLWLRLTAHAPSARAVAALNAALVLGADHGLAASTLAARVAASVRADPYSVVATGLATVSGPLHGAASAGIHRLLSEVGRPERAVAVVGEHLRRYKSIPGFGHVIYKGWDPRARILLEVIRKAGLDPGRMDVVEQVLELLEDRAPVYPNIDYVLASLTFASGMQEGGGEAIFGVARSAGWIAHALEEYQEPALRFRPRAHYVGLVPE